MTDIQSEDISGLDKIQEAMEKIEKLSSSEFEDSENEQTENEDNEDKEEQYEEDDENISSAEEDGEELAEEDVSEPKKQKEKKFWKERREKYKALAERDRIANELEELKRERDKALEVGNYHYGQNAYADLERAKFQKKKAIEDGDVDALMEADISLVRAANAIDEIERWNAQSNLQENKNTPKNTDVSVSSAQQEMARDWIESHPELNPNSSKYNTALAQKVGAYINALDSNIANSNQPEYYFSEDYFDVIDDHIAKLKRGSQKSNVAPASINNVAGVKKSYQSGSPSQNSNNRKIVLTSVEKTMASNAGLSEEEWLKFKIADLNKQQKGA